MNETSKLLFALQQTENIIKLMKGNEYEHYITTFLAPVNAELQRQLTNLKKSSKIEE